MFLMNQIVVTNLSVIKSGTTRLPPLSFCLNQAEFVGLIGANGVGKTTLVRTLIGLNSATAGDIKIADRDLDSLSHHERASWFSYIPQTRLPAGTGMTVEQVVATGRVRFFSHRTRPSSKRDDGIERALVLAQVAHLRARLFDELSGGEQQRVLVASAVAQEARFLILDEPTTFLDLSAAHEVMELLAYLCIEERFGVLVVCHDVSLLLSYASRMIALTNQGIAFDGRRDELLQSTILTTMYARPLRVILDPLGRFPCLVPCHLS